MSPREMREGTVVSKAFSQWDRFWFAEIPPHIYALLRIVLGVVALASLFGVRHLSTFWDVQGFVPRSVDGTGVKAFLLHSGLGSVGGRVLFFVSFACYLSMAVGFQTGLSVTLSLAAAILQLFWNWLPESAAHMVVQTILFCLVWADCGSVWSLDAWLARRRGRAADDPVSNRYAIAPLRLIRFQVALVYLNSGLWKLFSEHWRDGTAVHYVLNNNVYQRFPYQVPSSLDGLTVLLTYAVLFWEISFAFMILYRPTRRLALIVGIIMHLGMMTAIEIGPFGWVMLASYVSFLDPECVPSLPRRLRQFTLGHRAHSLEVGVETTPSDHVTF